MALNFNFNQFQTISDDDLVTIPDFEIFSDGGNPLIRRQTLVEVKPGEFTRMDVIADMDGLFFFADGRYILSYESDEGRTLNRVRELDKLSVIPYDVIVNFNF